MNNIVPFSVTVKAIGDDAYVVNNHFVNSYAHVEFNGSDNHLAENNMAQHIFRPFKVVNCKNGRFNHNNTRDEWDDSNLPTVGNIFNLMKYSMAKNISYEVINSKNQQFFASFSRMSNKLALFKNSNSFFVLFVSL